MMSTSTDAVVRSVPLSTAPDPGRRAWAASVAAVVFLGGALRLLRLGHESFWLDESYMAAAADRVLAPWTLFSVDYINDAPLYHFIIGFWSRFVAVVPGLDLGTAARDFAMRLPSAAIGTASVWGVYWFTEQLLRARAAALIAAFIFALSPFQLYYAQDLRPYALHVGLNIAAAIFLVRSLERNRPSDWMVFTSVCTLAIYNHFFMVFNVIAMNLYFVAFFRQHFNLLGRWIAANLAIIALSGPGLAMMLRVSSVYESASEDWYSTPDANLLLITFKNFFAGYSPQFAWYRPLIALAAALVTLGAWSLRRDMKRLVFLVIMGAAPLVLAAVYWRTVNFPYYTHRLMIFSAVPIYALAASGIARVPMRGLRAILVAVLAALMIPGMMDYYAQRAHPAVTHTMGWLYKADMRSASRFVQERMQDGDVIVHRLRYSQYPFRYYMGWDSPNYVGVPTRSSVVAQTQGYPNDAIYVNNHIMPHLLEGLIAGKIRVWYVDSWWRAGEEDGVARETMDLLADHGAQVLVQRFDGLTVYLFELRVGGAVAHQTHEGGKP